MGTVPTSWEARHFAMYEVLSEPSPGACSSHRGSECQPLQGSLLVERELPALSPALWAQLHALATKALAGGTQASTARSQPGAPKTLRQQSPDHLWLKVALICHIDLMCPHQGHRTKEPGGSLLAATPLKLVGPEDRLTPGELWPKASSFILTHRVMAGLSQAPAQRNAGSPGAPHQHNSLRSSVPINRLVFKE